MRVACISDIHGELPAIEENDLTIIAGDVCPFDQSHEPAHQYAWMQGVFSDWVESIPTKDVVWIGGNHDFGCQLESFTNLSVPWSHYLQDSGIELQGKKIWGYPHCPNLSNWAFYAKAGGFEKAIMQVPNDTDILILHSPPTWVTPIPNFPAEWLQPTFSQIAHVIRPELVVFGHIHQGYGSKHEFGTHWVNASHRDELYDPINPPIYIDLP